MTTKIVENPNDEHEVLNNPSTSKWLKNQIITSKERDPVDALLDAEILVGVLNLRLNQLNNEHGK